MKKVYLKIISDLLERCRNNTKTLTCPLSDSCFLSFTSFSHSLPPKLYFLFLHHLTVVCRCHATSKSIQGLSVVPVMTFLVRKWVSCFFWFRIEFRIICCISCSPLGFFTWKNSVAFVFYDFDIFEVDTPHLFCRPTLSLGSVSSGLESGYAFGQECSWWCCGLAEGITSGGMWCWPGCFLLVLKKFFPACILVCPLCSYES